MIMEISTDERFAFVLPVIKRKFGNNKNIAAKITRTKTRSKLFIRTKDKNKFAAEDLNEDMLKIIAKIIIKELKIYYFKTHIMLPKMQAVKAHVFIKALTAYDTKADLIIAASIIQITPQILLDSWYDFRLFPLQKRWAEVTDLVNRNAHDLRCPSTFNELLRFLVANLEHKIDEVHIIKNGKNIQIYTNNFSLYKNIGFDSISIIDALIDISPQTVFIHSTEKEAAANAIIKNIEAIFRNCIHITHTCDIAHQTGRGPIFSRRQAGAARNT